MIITDSSSTRLCTDDGTESDQSHVILAASKAWSKYVNRKSFHMNNMILISGITYELHFWFLDGNPDLNADSNLIAVEPSVQATLRFGTFLSNRSYNLDFLASM